MNELLTICITNYNCADFVLNNLYCLEKLTKNKYKVLIRDNESDITDYEKLKKNIKKYKNVKLYRVEDTPEMASMAHGMAVNDLISKIDTKYGVVLDADFAFLYKNWDDILINEITEDIPIIGMQAPPNPKSDKSDDFPYLFGFLFYTDILKRLEIDFLPTQSTENFKDTGYQLRDKFLEGGYKGKILKMRNTRIYKEGPFHKIISGEYYLEGYDRIFGCHFSRGHSLGKAKYLSGRKNKILTIPKIGPFILKSKGKRDRKRWIKICMKTADFIF